jgi:hypothetical protein
VRVLTSTRNSIVRTSTSSTKKPSFKIERRHFSDVCRTVERVNGRIRASNRLPEDALVLSHSTAIPVQSNRRGMPFSSLDLLCVTELRRMQEAL